MSEFLGSEGSRGPKCVIVPNFAAIGETVAEIRRFFDFSKMAAVRHLGFVMRVFGPPMKVFGGLYYCAIFGWKNLESIQ